MQLTRAADYAVRVLIHMATLPAGKVASRADIASAVGAPETFLSKVLQALNRAGMLESRRGLEGGYAASATTGKVSLLDVVEVIEGPLRLNVCLGNGISCERQQWCPAHLVWVRAQEAMVQVLRGAKIADLAAQAVERKSLLQKNNLEPNQPTTSAPDDGRPQEQWD